MFFSPYPSHPQNKKNKISAPNPVGLLRTPLPGCAPADAGPRKTDPARRADLRSPCGPPLVGRRYRSAEIEISRTVVTETWGSAPRPPGGLRPPRAGARVPSPGFKQKSRHWFGSLSAPQRLFSRSGKPTGHTAPKPAARAETALMRLAALIGGVS